VKTFGRINGTAKLMMIVQNVVVGIYPQAIVQRYKGTNPLPLLQLL